MLCIRTTPFKATVATSNRRNLQRCVRLTAQKQEQPASPTPAQPAQPSLPSNYRREYESFGSKVIETTEAIKGPEDEKDMWEGENFEKFGKTMEQYFLPAVVVLGLIIGGIAAGTYNDGADTFLQSATSDEASAELIPASALAPAPATSD